jgi:hypothetical protein
MPKDRLKSFFEVIAQGDATKIRLTGQGLLDEIQKDVAKLNRDARMIRDLLPRYGGAVDSMTPAQRSAKVREAALALAESGKSELTSQDVLDYLKSQGNPDFAVKRPASMVGSVLFQMPEFERVEMNRFRYRQAWVSVEDSQTSQQPDEGGEPIESLANKES